MDLSTITLRDERCAMLDGAELVEYQRTGNERYLLYTAPSGMSAHMHLILEPLGVAEVSVDPSSRVPNRFGAAEMRKAAAMLQRLYPGLIRLYGTRYTGARPLRIQTLRLRPDPTFDYPTPASQKEDRLARQRAFLLEQEARGVAWG